MKGSELQHINMRLHEFVNLAATFRSRVPLAGWLGPVLEDVPQVGATVPAHHLSPDQVRIRHDPQKVGTNCKSKIITYKVIF